MTKEELVALARQAASSSQVGNSTISPPLVSAPPTAVMAGSVSMP